MAGIQVDGANQKVVLDSDGDTYLEAATDDTIKVYVAGAHDATISANAINVLSGTTLTIDSGATITNSGTANGFGTDPDGAQVFNESSADVDFRIESNGNANMFFLDGGDNTIKVASPTNVPGLGVNPHLQVSASSPFISINTASADAGSGALIFTKGRSATVGTATVVQDNDSLGGIFWAAADGTDFTSAAASIKANIDGTPGGNDVPGEIVFATTADGAASATDRLTISAAGVVSLAASSKLSVGDTAPDCSIGGLTLNQGADDGEILTLKSSDVGHLMTDNAEADTYAEFKKARSNDGGIEIHGYSEHTEQGVKFAAFTTGAMPTDKSTSVRGSIEATAYIRDGNGATASITDNGNVMIIRAGNTTRFIFDEDGDFHADASSNTFDAYDDAQLVRAYDLSHGKGVIDSKFDKFVAYNHENLADLKLVGREEDGAPNHFINVCGMQRLHNGAIWQQYEKHNQLLEAVYDLAKEAVGEDKANAILDKHEVKRLN